MEQTLSTSQIVSITIMNTFKGLLLTIWKHFAGAQAYITIEEFEKAVEDCDTAIKIDPNFTKVC